MPTPVAVLSGGTRGFELGMFKKGPVAQGFNFPLNTNYTWWNGVDILSTQYLIYTDKYTMGSSTLANTIPVAWSTPDLNDSSLLALINTLPPRVGLPGFTDLDAALNWMDGTGDFFLLKNGIENIVTTNLLLYWDAGLYTSYGGTGTVVSDLSGNNKNGNLTNGASFSSAGVASFDLDGTNDYISIGTLSYSNNITVEAWVNTTNPIGWDDIIAGGCGDLLFGVDSSNTGTVSWGGQCNSPFPPVTSTTSISDGRWHHVVGTYNGSTAAIYVDGILERSLARSGSFTPGTIAVGSAGGGGEHFSGNVAIARIYATALTADQVLQNYNAQKWRFGLPSPVTDGLVAQLEAANPSSYPGSGTVWYDISGNGNNFTLFNGASYDSTTKSMVFDGSDDYGRSTNFIDLSTATATTVQTIHKQNNTNIYMLWEHTPDWNSNSGGFGQVVNSNGSSLVVNEFHANWNGQSARNFVNTTPSSLSFLSLAHRLIPNNILGFQDWVNTDLQTYVGPLYPTGTSTEGNTNGFANNYTFLASRNGSSLRLNGNIGVFLMYRRALSQPEIVQNYEYYRDIYGLSGVSKNGLVLWYDAGNAQSYNGVGTTWNDISGSMIDGRLLNGVTYSTDGGGSFVFDGADDYISCGTSIPPAGNISVFDWVYVTTFQNPWNILITKWFDPSASDFHWALKNDGTGYKQNLYTTNNSDMYGNTIFSTGTWYYVGFTLVNGGTLTFYVNGNTDGTHSSVSRTPQSSNLIIGDNRNVAYGLVGKMGTVQIYNRTLSGSEVLQNFNAQRGRYGV